MPGLYFRHLSWVIALACSTSVYAEDLPILRILNWTEYIDIDSTIDESKSIAERSPTLRAFSESFGCIVQYNEYETTDEAMRLLTQAPGYYDIVIIDDFASYQLVAAELAKTPDAELIPNLEHIDPVLKKAFSQGSELVGTPYLYGTTGILYRKDYYPEGIPSWKAFFDTKQAHKISVFADPRAVFFQALLAKGLAPVSPVESNIREAAKFLQLVADSGRIVMTTSDIEEIQSSVSEGKIGAAVIYSGDALTVIERDPNLAFSLPEEGFELYLDRMLIVEGSQKTSLAHAFVNFVLEPENHARLARELFYACPNKSSIEILEREAPEQLSNLAIYPTNEQLGNGYPLVIDSPLVPRFFEHLFGY